MAVSVYYPQGSLMLQRNTASGSYAVAVFNVPSNAIFWFDTSGSISSSIITIDTSSYSMTSSYLIGSVATTSWSYLTASANGVTGSVTWNCASNVYEDRRILQMSASNYISMSISGLYNGWQGALQTVQSGSLAASILSISPTPKVVNNGMGQLYLTSGSGAIDILGLSYDGANLLVSYGSHFS